MDIKALVIRDTDSIPAWASPLPGLGNAAVCFAWEAWELWGENRAGKWGWGQELHGPGASPRGSEYPWGSGASSLFKEPVVTGSSFS